MKFNTMKTVGNLVYRYLHVYKVSWRLCVSYLCFYLSLSLFQQLGHHHRPVSARTFTAHCPLTQQGHHGVIVWGHLDRSMHGEILWLKTEML